MVKKLTTVLILISLLILSAPGAQAEISTKKVDNNKLKSGDKIPGEYIVVLKKKASTTDKESKRMEKSYGFKTKLRYKSALKGFSVNLTNTQLKKLQKDPSVQSISQDEVLTMDESFNSNAVYSSLTPQVVDLGLTRIGGGNNIHKGTGVGVAVLDTGIDFTHPDLINNISPHNHTCISGTTDANDDNGHGSYIAGIIAGEDNGFGVLGVAPRATLFAVKVLGVSGASQVGSVICGLDWVTANAVAYGIKVVNMSLSSASAGRLSDGNCGQTDGDTLHQAVCNTAAVGVTLVSSAGNGGVDSIAGGVRPAEYQDAVIAVGALNDTDGLPGGLGGDGDDTFGYNWGSAVSISAPGINVYGDYMNGQYLSASGTSPSTAFVSGAIALLLEGNPTAKIKQTLPLAYKTRPIGSTWMRARNLLILLGEQLNSGHTDPTGKHLEPILNISTL